MYVALSLAEAVVGEMVETDMFATSCSMVACSDVVGFALDCWMTNVLCVAVLLGSTERLSYCCFLNRVRRVERDGVQYEESWDESIGRDSGHKITEINVEFLEVSRVSLHRVD